MTEAIVKITQGKGFGISIIVTMLLTIVTCAITIGRMSERLDVASATVARNTADINSLTTNLTAIKTGQEGIAKNVDRILNRLDTAASQR